MSKASLRKELQNFTNEQLIELILAVYAARPEAKEYFEFFLNPDADTVFNKYLEEGRKEMMRVKWGRAKFRISHIRKLIKNFAALDPGPEYVLRLMSIMIEFILVMEQGYYMTATQTNGAKRLAADMMKYAEANQEFTTGVKYLQRVMSAPPIKDRRLANDVAEAAGL